MKLLLENWRKLLESLESDNVVHIPTKLTLVELYKSYLEHLGEAIKKLEEIERSLRPSSDVYRIGLTLRDLRDARDDKELKYDIEEE